MALNFKISTGARNAAGWHWQSKGELRLLSVTTLIRPLTASADLREDVPSSKTPALRTG